MFFFLFRGRKISGRAALQLAQKKIFCKMKKWNSSKRQGHFSSLLMSVLSLTKDVGI